MSCHQKIAPGELPAACLLSAVTHLDTKRSLILYLSFLTPHVDSVANISPGTRSYSSGMTRKFTQVLCEEFQEGASYFHCSKHAEPNSLEPFEADTHTLCYSSHSSPQLRACPREFTAVTDGTLFAKRISSSFYLPAAL